MNLIIKKFFLIINLLDKSCEKMVFLLLTALIITVNLEIISRSFFDYSFTWVEEVAKYMVVWCAFLGGICASNRKLHPVIGVLIDKVSGRVYSTIQSMVYLITSLGLFSMGYYAIVFTKTGQDLVMTALPTIPMSVVYVSIPIGCFGMGLCFIKKLVELFFSDDSIHS